MHLPKPKLSKYDFNHYGYNQYGYENISHTSLLEPKVDHSKCPSSTNQR